MAHRRFHLLATALLLVTVACAGLPESTPQLPPGFPGQEEADPGGPEQPSAAPGGQGQPTVPPQAGEPPAGGDGPAGAPGGQGAALADTPAPSPGLSDLGGVGSMCRHYLRPQVPRLVVEIDYQAGARPTAGAVEHLMAVLSSVADKPGGVVLAGGKEIPGGAATWTPEALRATAERYRTQYSGTQQAAVYVLSVRGEFVERESIGVAHRASEFALFPDRIDALSLLLGGQTALERSVLVHELGHLLCLVNIGYRSTIDHEDPEHPNHSSDPSSVMYWAIETSAVAQLFTGPPPNDFTVNDRADLEGLRTGLY